MKNKYKVELIKECVTYGSSVDEAIESAKFWVEEVLEIRPIQWNKIKCTKIRELSDKEKKPIEGKIKKINNKDFFEL